MKISAQVMILAGPRLPARDIEPCVHDAGHRVHAAAHTVDECAHLIGDDAGAFSRPDVLLVAIEQGRDSASAAALATLLRVHELPVVYVAGQPEELAPAGRERDEAPAEEDIACLLQPRELSLAIRLALRARDSGRAASRSEERYAAMFRRAAVPMWEIYSPRLQQAIEELRDQGVTDLRAYLDEDPGRMLQLMGLIEMAEINDAALEVFGARSREHMQGSFQELFLPESLERSREILIALAEGKKFVEYECVFRSFHGDIRWVLFRVSIPVPGDSLRNMLVSCLDITERKRAEERIQQLNTDLSQRAAELQAANVELEWFSYSVSHDLRAPLRAMEGFSTVLLEDHTAGLDERGLRYLQRIRNASKRMSRLIDDLLSLSRMSRSTLHLETCDLSAMADSVVRELRQAQPERDVEVAIESGIQVEADRNLLHVILANLLGNAWKFTSRQARAHIELGHTRRAGRRAYFVRDNGAGFDMAYADKLFGPFQRLHGMDEFEGTGIGLATVKRIVHRHGGEVWAEGQVDAGATFGFTLP